MFDKDNVIIVGDSAITGTIRVEGDDSGIIAAIAACTGAIAVQLIPLSIEPPSSSRPSLAQYPLLSSNVQDRIEDIVHEQTLGGKTVWLTRTGEQVLCVPILTNQHSPVCMALSYPLASLDSHMRIEAEKKANMIAPMVRCHLRMAAQVIDLSCKIDGTTGLINACEVGMILFDNRGHMVMANDAARKILDAQDGLRMGSRAPVPVSLKDATRFHLALDHQIAENAAGRKTRQESTVFLIHRQDGRRPFVATLIPTPCPASEHEAAVMLFLFDPSRQSLDHLSAICELYGLSHVESRLAQHLASGMTVDEAASMMRIKSPTARTYLKQIFLKTDTHRQADLVRLLILSTGQIMSHMRTEALH